MRTIADLITEWIEAKPNRSLAHLSRVTGISKATISSVAGGRRPSLATALKLRKVLPPEAILTVICSNDPELETFMDVFAEIYICLD